MKQDVNTPSMKHLEQLAAAYADARAQLVERAGRLQRELDAARSEHLPGIRSAHNQLGEAQIALRDAIEAAPTLFEKPKTRIVHGVKFGYQVHKGRVVFADEAATIARIRKLLPEEQAELMINTKESVHKPAVNDLSAADLKRLGITVTSDQDRIVIKSTDSAVDKLIAALTADLDKMMEE